jgi:hypothetical protein
LPEPAMTVKGPAASGTSRQTAHAGARGITIRRCMQMPRYIKTLVACLEHQRDRGSCRRPRISAPF